MHLLDPLGALTKAFHLDRMSGRPAGRGQPRPGERPDPVVCQVWDGLSLVQAPGGLSSPATKARRQRTRGPLAGTDPFSPLPPWPPLAITLQR